MEMGRVGTLVFLTINPEGVWHPGQGSLPRYPVTLWGAPLVGPSPMDIMRPDHHRRKVWNISFAPSQEIPQGDTGRPHISQYIQCYHGRHHTPLGDGGGRWKGRSIGPWVVNTVLGCIFLRWQQPDYVDAGGTSITSFWYPYWPLGMYWPEEKSPQNDENGFSTVPLRWQNVDIGVHMPNDRVGGDILGSAEAAGLISGVRGRSGHRDPLDASPHPSRHWKGGPGCMNPL